MGTWTETVAVGPDAILVKVVASLEFGTRIWQLGKDMPAPNYEVYENQFSRSQVIPLAASLKRMQSSSSVQSWMVICTKYKGWRSLRDHFGWELEP